VDFVFVVFISGLIGSRLLHVILNFSYYSSNPLEIIMINRGGLAVQGGIVASILCGYLFLRFNKINIWKASDLIVPFVALGQSIGRMGCFLNGCCYGVFIGSCPIAEQSIQHFFMRLPVQLFASLAMLAVYVILRICLQKNILQSNLVFLYVILYSGQRFVIDFFRADIQNFYFGLKLSQLICIVMFIVSLVALLFRLRKKA